MTMVGIRTALAGLLDEAADVSIVYAGQPQPAPLADDQPFIRFAMGLPSRRLVGSEASRIVQQDGTATMQIMFPRDYGAARVAALVEDVVATYRQQTIDGVITLTGDARTARIGTDASGRMRWDVTVQWRTVEHEPIRGDTAPRRALQTIPEALLAMRTLWHAQVELASSGWSGLSTFYDDEPTWQKPPAVPFAGVWTDTIQGFGADASGTEQVLGRSLVQLHTDKVGGDATTLGIVDRIIDVHSRMNAGIVIAPVETIGQVVSPAGTTQTNLRIPFTFERARP